MRTLIGTLLLASLWFGFSDSSSSSSRPESETGVTLYDSNPNHLWNRLHSAIFVRPDIPSTAEVPDALDPPLWLSTRYLLAQPSHDRILRLLDEFLETHGERLIQYPLKRAILQRDLWAVFDWSVTREPDQEHFGDLAYEKERTELQSRLAAVMRRVALTPAEVRALPSNYAQTVASGQFAKDYDSDHPERPFLPPNLLDPRGPWVQITPNGAGEPVAGEHTAQFSRSSFLVFMRLPGGRKATFDYLETLWNFPQPWVPRPDDPRHEQTMENPELPQFPAGTMVALVRQMLLPDSQGNLTPTPITESVQLRVYRTISAPSANAMFPSSVEDGIRATGQNFYQFTMTRSLLFAGKGLKALGADEKEFTMFQAFGADEGSPKQYVSLDKYPPVLKTCFECHRGQGINSVNSRTHLLRPNWLQHEWQPGVYDPGDAWWEFADTSAKQIRFDWGLLSGYWKAAGSH
jgi:hypothetical protein